MNRPKIALLMGGDSAERRVSYLSGRAVWSALAEAGRDVTAFDVSSPQTRKEADFRDLLSPAQREELRPVTWPQLASVLMEEGFSVAFPVLHSGRGEDGTLAALLDVAGVPFVGSPMAASALAMDKAACKAVLRDYGVPSPRGLIVERGEVPDVSNFANGCVVKPNSSGSSVGVTIFRQEPDQNALREAISAALVDGPALVEEFIEGVEVTCPTLGEGKETRALPVIEIVPESGGGFYDFEAKYAPGGSRHLIPPRLPEAVQARVQELAARAHRVLGCRDVARSDFLVTGEGDVYFLEINTLPGMTGTSLVPDAARAVGLDFPQLLDTLIEGALKRSP